MLNDYGFAYVFDNPFTVHVKPFINDFKCRIIYTFKQEWYGNISTSSVLDIIFLNFLGLCYIFRFGTIQSGRYARNNIPRNYVVTVGT